MPLKKMNKAEENILFFKQFVRNPKSLGSITPSSPSLGRFISQHIYHRASKEGYIVEIGAGTGSLTRCLLASGIDPSRIFVIELDSDMADYLKKILPSSVSVICGNAEKLEHLLPPHVVGNVSSIVSGIPMMNCTISQQARLVASWRKILSANGGILQFTYGPLSPLPADRLGLVKKRLGHVFLNIPPATIWKYSLRKNDSRAKIPLKSRIKTFMNKEFKKITPNK